MRLLNKRKETCGLGEIYTKKFPSPQAQERSII
nr:MAG TPA: hypothetical protein [Caudoviricetes sp.]